MISFHWDIFVRILRSHINISVVFEIFQIHTGLQHKVIYPPQPNALPLEFPTLADKLRQLGYATHIVGKWHVGFYKREYMPTRRGFDSHYGKRLAGLQTSLSHNQREFRFYVL